jgi:glycosyltransferase involved in cell wall biosynthesis
MNIALISTNSSKGGAAMAAQRVYRGIVEQNPKTNYYVCKQQEDSHKLNGNFLYNPQIESLIQLDYIQQHRSALSDTLFSMSFYTSKISQLIEENDIINLHWIESCISLNNFEELANSGKPVVWTLHDMKPFTGGCHYSAGCEAYVSGCFNCLQLKEDPMSLTSKVLDLKRLLIQGMNITVISPSRWLAEQARKSVVFAEKRIEVIPNGIDHHVLKPMDKKSAKKHFNIDAKKIVILFGADNQGSGRKGYKELKAAIEINKEHLKRLNCVALFFGLNSNDDLALETYDAGYIKSEEELKILYSAADMFVIPSLEDNFPNTILESMACGTPVIGFDTGGIGEIVDHSVGTVVPKEDVRALADAIVEFASNQSKRETCGKNARVLIENRYTLEIQAQKYLKLFDQLKWRSNSKKIDCDIFTTLDSLAGYLMRKNKKRDQSLLFSQQFSNLYGDIEKLKLDNKKYVVYGAGTFGKLVNFVLSKQIVLVVDRASKMICSTPEHGVVYNPQSLLNIDFDNIVIAVLGREKEIVEYLVHLLKIDEEKIIIFTI